MTVKRGVSRPSSNGKLDLVKCPMIAPPEKAKTSQAPHQNTARETLAAASKTRQAKLKGNIASVNKKLLRGNSGGLRRPRKWKPAPLGRNGAEWPSRRIT